MAKPTDTELLRRLVAFIGEWLAEYGEAQNVSHARVQELAIGVQTILLAARPHPRSSDQ